MISAQSTIDELKRINIATQVLCELAENIKQQDIIPDNILIFISLVKSAEYINNRAKVLSKRADEILELEKECNP